MPRSQIREITTVEFDPVQNHETGSDATRIKGVNLDFPGESTQHATHALHPYVAAINPPLASSLLRHYTKPGDHVLDPFCGGGGVLVECLLNGNKATGYDVNPLAYHISRGKTAHASSAKLVRELQNIVATIKPDKKAPSTVPDVVAFWYYPYVLEWLVPLSKHINAISDLEVRAAFQVALSATARDVMLTYRGEVRLRRLREKDQERFKPVVLDAFRKRAELAVDRVGKLPKKPQIEVNFSDCREIGKGRRFDAVITSPPYGDDKNGVGYFQFSRNMLYFLGHSLEEIKEARNSFLGIGTKEVPTDWTPPPSLQEYLVHIGARSERLYKDALHFYYDYYCALKRIAEVTKNHLIVVTGDRVLARTFMDNGRITFEMLESLGWPLEHYYLREIRKKRIANLGGDGGQISHEHILVHRKS